MRRAAPAKLTGLWCDNMRLGFGLTLYACFAREGVGPVGFVWGMLMGAGNSGKTRFEVIGSYVVPWARRAGVRTELNRAILRHADSITTQSGSKDGGLAFLRTSGYRMDKATGVWSLTKGRKR